MDTLYDKKETCLYCDNPFTTKKVRSKNAIATKRDEDFCHYYKEDNPYFYEISICPFCNFAFSNNFAPLKNAAKEQVKNGYVGKVQSFELQGRRDIHMAITCYKLALFSATISNQNNFTLSQLCLRLAWLYRFQEDKAEEIRFLKNTLDLYQKIYEKEDLDNLPINKFLLMYMLGELNGRLGDYVNTRKWFSLVISEKDVEPKILNITRERWMDYKYDKEK